MYRFVRALHFTCLLIFAESACHSQTQQQAPMGPSDQQLVTRSAAVAGQFYPGSAEALKSELKSFFAGLSGADARMNVRAVIVPHAGYVYSGAVAAHAFADIPRDSEFDNVFVIGSSHRVAFEGASVYTRGNFITPLGEVPVNLELAGNLVKNQSLFSERTDAQLAEHSLEVQLPFLQYWLQKPFRIVPIVLGTQNPATCRKIADILRPYFTGSNLFVISSDFSHYPGYRDANTVDHRTAEAIMSNDPEVLENVLDANDGKGIPGLVTSLCGWTSVMTLLHLTKGKELEFRLVDYKNSGDAADYGDKSRVVGYCAITISENKTPQPEFHIDQHDCEVMLESARNTIDSYLRTGKIPVLAPSGLSPALRTHAGAFVSLYKDGNLRGCIGRFNPDEPLFRVVQEMAVAAATRDTRFEPVTPGELASLSLEISVLTPLKRIQSADEIELGRHGIYMVKGTNAGTFLPQVATSTGWNLEEFLGHCARDKAGIGWNGWKDAELFTYEAIICKEE